jgi:Fe-S cluster assembly protein SufD
MSAGTWLDEAREKAWEEYISAPMPGRTAHLWRYTAPELFAPADKPRVPPAPEATGLMSPTVPDGFSRAGARVADLRDAAESDPGLVGGNLGKAVGASAGKFEALNMACWQQGLLVHVPRGCVLQDPVHLATNIGSDPFTATRLLVVVEEGAALTLVDCYMGGGADGAPALANSVVEIFAAPGSHVRYVTVQNLGPRITFHLAQRAHAAEGAKLDAVLVSFGSAVTKANVGSCLRGRGAECESYGVIVGDGAQHFDHHTVHEHVAGGTRSNFNYKTILKDSARSVFTGVIRIEREAGGCEAYQENRNIMLSENARADSIPELEIMNNDVRCSHGATMGPIEPDYIFYLMSRGMPRSEAVRMIVAGFAETAFARLPEGLRGHLRRHLDLRLEAL